MVDLSILKQTKKKEPGNEIPRNDSPKENVNSFFGKPSPTEPNTTDNFTQHAYIEKFIEEWKCFPNGQRYFVKKYPIGSARYTPKIKKSKAQKIKGKVDIQPQEVI